MGKLKIEGENTARRSINDINKCKKAFLDIEVQSKDNVTAKCRSSLKKPVGLYYRYSTMKLQWGTNIVSVIDLRVVGWLGWVD